MDDKTIIDITNLDAEKHAENAAKRVASYSEKLLHHASILSEKEYQKFLLERLEKDNGYVIRKASDFDRYFAVDREMLFKFLEDTQHETMEYLRKIYKSDLEETIVSFINAETTKTRGSLLDVLKHGIEISNQKLELMYTKPATTFNPDLTRKYGQNIFSASDIHLQRGNTVLIIDAKYYSHTTQSQFDKHTIHSNNLYQIFTYVKNRSYQFGEEKNTVSGMLLYAKTEEEIQPDNVYQMHGSQISVKTLDLNQPFAEIANQMDRIVESHFSGLAKKY